MDFSQGFKQMNFTKYKRIGGVIPCGVITMFTGLPGTGKSFSLMKFLNQQGVKPFVFNLDEDPELANFNFIGMTSDKEALLAFIEGQAEGIDGEVIVIDTYARLSEYYGTGQNTLKDQLEITQKLENLCKTKGYTIIVVGHPEDYVGKSSIFKDNQSLMRNSHEHLHIDKIQSTGRKQEPILYRFYISKGRGIGGASSIDNWMR